MADFLATMLRQQPLRSSVRVAAGEWIKDLIPALGASTPVLGECNDAELAALNWCAAQFAFAQAHALAPDRVLSLDFSDFLQSPERHLGLLARHFGIEYADRDLGHALSGPWMRRYAKDPRYPFDSAERTRELEAVKSRLADEIAAGRQFARRLWQRLPMANAFTEPG